MSTRKHAAYQLRTLPKRLGRVFNKNAPPVEELYHFNDEKNRATYVDKRELQHVERGEKQA